LLKKWNRRARNEARVKELPARFIVKSEARLLPPLSLIIFVAKIRQPGPTFLLLLALLFDSVSSESVSLLHYRLLAEGVSLLMVFVK
jgi:hypothetical protein